MRGQFYFPSLGLTIPNTVVDEGEEAFIKMITRGDTSVIAGGANFYIGLCSVAVSESLTLASSLGEPTNAGGYSRKAVSRDAAGWPTIDQVNGDWRAVTKEVVFSASGADYSTSILQAFLCSSADNSGKLLAVSGALPAAKLITDGMSFPVRYELLMK